MIGIWFIYQENDGNYTRGKTEMESVTLILIFSGKKIGNNGEKFLIKLDVSYKRKCMIPKNYFYHENILFYVV